MPLQRVGSRKYPPQIHCIIQDKLKTSPFGCSSKFHIRYYNVELSFGLSLNLICFTSGTIQKYSLKRCVAFVVSAAGLT